MSRPLRIILAALLTGYAHSQCPPGYSYADRACFKVIPSRMSYTEAEAACAADTGGHLAVVRSPGQHDYLEGVLLLMNECAGKGWLGLRRDSTRSWRFVKDGTLHFGFEQWEPPEDFLSGENCARFSAYKGLWEDVSCNVGDYQECPICQHHVFGFGDGDYYTKPDGAPAQSRASSGATVLAARPAVETALECAVLCRSSQDCSGFHFRGADSFCELLDVTDSVAFSAEPGTEFFNVNL